MAQQKPILSEVRMPRTCTICRHAQREEIDQALLAAEPFRNIAKRYGTSPTALFRHRQKDLPTALLKARQVAEVVSAETLLDRLKSLNEETAAILREARAAGSRDNELALKAIARVERQLEFEARLLGELSSTTNIGVGVSIGMNDPARRLAELQAGRERARRATLRLTEAREGVALQHVAETLRAE